MHDTYHIHKQRRISSYIAIMPLCEIRIQTQLPLIAVFFNYPMCVFFNFILKGAGKKIVCSFLSDF